MDIHEMATILRQQNEQRMAEAIELRRRNKKRGLNPAAKQFTNYELYVASSSMGSQHSGFAFS